MMLGLLVVWAALLVLLVAFAIGRPGKGGALTLAYFLGLSLIHVPGALPFLSPDSGLVDEEETQLGFEMTILGMATFAVGAVIQRLMDRQHTTAGAVAKPGREQALQQLGRRAIVLGVVGYFVLIPLSFRVASLTSLVSPLGTLLILGFWLLLYAAAKAADRRMMLATLALLPLLPLATLVTGGFLGYGVFWVLSILAFLFVIARRRTWFYVSAPIAVFLGLSLFVTYMGQRGGIREVVWQEQSNIFDRLDRALGLVTRFQLLDVTSPDHLAALDGRLNQNWLVGAGVVSHEVGGTPFVYGATIPLWSLIPRAVWPDKPGIGGGGTVITDFTGLQFAEGTSVGPGNVLEFYINFGIPGVLIGFFGFGYLLMWLDQGIMRALAANDMRGFLLRGMPGLMLLQPQGNLIEILVACVAAYVIAHLLVSLKFFNVPLAARPRRQMA